MESWNRGIVYRGNVEAWRREFVEPGGQKKWNGGIVEAFIRGDGKEWRREFVESGGQKNVESLNRGIVYWDDGWESLNYVGAHSCAQRQ
ncbi:MAG: hypothetical protein ACK5JU_09365 [Bacteroidales bacterium]